MLQEVRKAKGFSQNDLALLSNVNLRMIQHYEQGVKDINVAKLDTLLNLSIALECSIKDLLTNEELIEKCKRTSL